MLTYLPTYSTSNRYQTQLVYILIFLNSLSFADMIIAQILSVQSVTDIFDKMQHLTFVVFNICCLYLFIYFK